MSHRVLGIDPGTRLCGYGIIESGRSRSEICVVESGTIKLNPKDSIPQRLLVLHRELELILQRSAPDQLAIEELIFVKNPTSALKLGHARGVVILACMQAKLGVHSYSPNAIKKAVTGHGHAKKNQVQQMVKMICGLAQLPGEDEADALAAAICHYHAQQSLLSRVAR